MGRLKKKKNGKIDWSSVEGSSKTEDAIKRDLVRVQTSGVGEDKRGGRV